MRGVLGHLAPVHRCARVVCCVACATSWATWLLFTDVPAWFVVLRVRCRGPLGSCSPVCPRGLLCCVCDVLGHLAPVHRCARSMRCFAFAMSWATWLLFTGVPARCVVLRVRCPGPLGSCSPVCPLGELLCLCGVLGHLAPVHRRARAVCCFACAVSWATWLLFTGVPARCVVLLVRCPGPLGSCSPVCPLGALLCVCGVLGHLAPVQRCARSVRCLCVRCRGPLGSCSPVCPFGALLCLCGVLGHLAPVHRCARVVCCVACAVSWATWLLLTGVPAWFVVLRVRCPGPLGSCSPVCPLRALLCVCVVLGHLAPDHRCARSVRCFACAMSWATWLLFTGVPARCVVWRERCPGPLGSCSPVCLLGVLFCLCGVLGHLAPVHQCARSVRCFVCALSWATWLLFTGVPAGCVVLRVQSPGPLGSCSPVCPLGICFACAVCRPLGSCSPLCPLGALLCVCRVLGHLGPVHRCARSVSCFACAESWATWLLFTGVPARGVACVCGVLGHLAPVHRCARSVCCFPCAVSWASWLLFTGVPARRVACVCSVLGLLAPVHRCARSVCCFACAVSWATWLLFIGVPARRVACVCGVLGHLAPVHQCARWVRCFACAVYWTTWLRFTGELAPCVVLWVPCAGRRCGALTRPSGRRLFVAGRGWVPSGRALVHPDGGCS